jgi:Holliday junction resolvase RusA-like endonuclease
MIPLATVLRTALRVSKDAVQFDSWSVHIFRWSVREIFNTLSDDLRIDRPIKYLISVFISFPDKTLQILHISEFTETIFGHRHHSCAKNREKINEHSV